MSVMLDYHEDRTDRPVASDFYRNESGGIARDIWVNAEGFRRFFEIPENERLEGWWMIINKKFSESISAVGKIFARSDRSQTYRITIVDHTMKARYKFLDQQMKNLTVAFVKAEMAAGRTLDGIRN